MGRTKTYYSGKKKSKYQVLLDLISLFIREKEFCSLYYALGFDQKGAEISGYMGKKRIFALKEKAEKKLKEELGTELKYDVVTKDKFYAGSILKANGVPALVDLALISHGELYIMGKGINGFDKLPSLGSELVIKNVALEASEGVFFVDFIESRVFINGKESSFSRLQQKISIGAWVVQTKQKSHPEIVKFNASALNVMRVVTIFDGKDVTLIGGFQAFATGNAKTDSWSEGSIYVGVDFEKGSLQKYGFRSPWHEGPGLVLEHPDSKITFENHPIPFINEIKELCISTHRLFYTNFLLGWDIAITESGPIVVEINEKPGMNVMQCADHNTTFFLSGLWEKRIK